MRTEPAERVTVNRVEINISSPLPANNRLTAWILQGMLSSGPHTAFDPQSAGNRKSCLTPKKVEFPCDLFAPSPVLPYE